MAWLIKINVQIHAVMLKRVFLFAIGVLVLSCQTSKRALTKDSLSVIAKGALHGAGEEGIKAQQTVIDDRVHWREFKIKMNTVNPISDQFQNTPVDFSSEMVLVLFDKVRRSGGYVFGIDAIEETEKEIIVKIREKKPKGMTTSVLEQPFYLAKIPKTGKKIIFKKVD